MTYLYIRAGITVYMVYDTADRWPFCLEEAIDTVVFAQLHLSTLSRYQHLTISSKSSVINRALYLCECRMQCPMRIWGSRRLYSRLINGAGQSPAQHVRQSCVRRKLVSTRDYLRSQVQDENLIAILGRIKLSNIYFHFLDALHMIPSRTYRTP